MTAGTDSAEWSQVYHQGVGTAMPNTVFSILVPDTDDMKPICRENKAETVTLNRNVEK